MYKLCCDNDIIINNKKEKKMKNFKKILSFALVICLMVPAMILLTACQSNIAEVSSFEELTQALEGDSSVIKLTADIDVPTNAVVARKVTLDLNGNKLYNTNDIWDDSEGVKVWSIISVVENGDLTITGNGEINSKENDCFAVDVRDGGKLVIENGTFVGNCHAIYVFKGEATINGGHYSILQTFSASQPYQFVLNLYDANRRDGTATLTVTGGEFEKFDPANCEAEGKGTNFVADGYVSEIIDGTEDTYRVVKAN
jgi:hypothetical protein